MGAAGEAGSWDWWRWCPGDVSDYLVFGGSDWCLTLRGQDQVKDLNVPRVVTESRLSKIQPTITLRERMGPTR